MYFALIRFQPYNAGTGLVGRIKVLVSADVWLILPPDQRTMTGPETRRREPGNRLDMARWSDAMGNAKGWL